MNSVPIMITVERTKDRGGWTHLRSSVLEGPCRHPQVDIRVVDYGLAEVLCLTCGHEWKSVKVVVL